MTPTRSGKVVNCQTAAERAGRAAHFVLFHTIASWKLGNREAFALTSRKNSVLVLVVWLDLDWR